MKQRRAFRRFVISASICLLLGAIVNIAVAWALPNVRPYTVSEEMVEPTIADSNFISAFGEAMDDSRPVVIESGAGWRRRLIPLAETDAYWEHAFTVDAASPYLGRPARPDLTVESAGWPCLAVQGVWTWRERRGIFVVSNDQVEWAITYVPIWPGFAINTLFYAAILWLVFTAPFALRRRRRINRGLCPACAYPIGTSDLCTECGKPVTARSVEPASP